MTESYAHDMPIDSPAWELPITHLNQAFEAGYYPADQASDLMLRFCAEMVRSGQLIDLGELQTHLRKRDALAQLVAVPFSEATYPDTRCVDVLTQEKKPRVLHVAYGRGAAARLLGKSSVSDEVNEMLLAHDTGFPLSKVKNSRHF